MTGLLTCTWAPTVLDGPHLFGGEPRAAAAAPSGAELASRIVEPARQIDTLGIDFLLVAQRWWGSAREIEGSSFDCLAMTAWYAAITERVHLITAIHPGFFLPAPVAKWGASLDRLTRGRWSINVTSGWHLREFDMFGAELVEHDERYARSREFIDVLRGAWAHETFSFDGRYYRVEDLRLEPRPFSERLQVFQGGQSEAAMDMAAESSDWMFLNGGRPEKIGGLIDAVRERAATTGRRIRFALYAIPVCRESDSEAEDVISELLAARSAERVDERRAAVSGAEGMWAESGDELSHLDTNEGFASRLIGTPATILDRLREFKALGIDCLHVALVDERFNREVLPQLKALE